MIFFALMMISPDIYAASCTQECYTGDDCPINNSCSNSSNMPGATCICFQEGCTARCMCSFTVPGAGVMWVTAEASCSGGIGPKPPPPDDPLGP